MAFFLALILAPLIFLTFCFAVELFVGIAPLRTEAGARIGAVRAVIVVPAHDEAAILESRLSALAAAAEGRAGILLVADNCSDSTAEIGRRLRVEVIERFDPSRRGKGFALDFARNHLEQDPPDIVLIVDADCMIDGPSLTDLIASCALSGRPCQSTNLQRPPPGASPAVQLSTFAFFIKNVIRQRALQRLAGRVNLLGTGMALPWQIFGHAQLATSNIVEDLKLGQELADAGHGPLFVEAAVVWSNAETAGNTLSQRRRWEGGFLENAVRAAPRLFVKSLFRLDFRTLWAAINLMIPPFALLILLDLVALLVGALICWATGASEWPLLLLAGGVLVAAFALGLAWRAGGSRFVTLQGLARAPFYIVWKLPMYVGFMRQGAPKEWTRTGRG